MAGVRDTSLFSFCAGEPQSGCQDPWMATSRSTNLLHSIALNIRLPGSIMILYKFGILDTNLLSLIQFLFVC